jgi:hypothetical protein
MVRRQGELGTTLNPDAYFCNLLFCHIRPRD